MHRVSIIAIRLPRRSLGEGGSLACHAGACPVVALAKMEALAKAGHSPATPACPVVALAKMEAMAKAGHSLLPPLRLLLACRAIALRRRLLVPFECLRALSLFATAPDRPPAQPSFPSCTWERTVAAPLAPPPKRFGAQEAAGAHLRRGARRHIRLAQCRHRAVATGLIFSLRSRPNTGCSPTSASTRHRRRSSPRRS